MLRICLLLLVAAACHGQSAVVIETAKKTSTASLRENLFKLASPEMEGRGIASRGDTLASRVVEKWFSSHGLEAPYGNGKSYFQEITVNHVASTGTLSIGSSMFALGKGWMVVPRSTVKLAPSPVLLTFYKTPAELSAAASDPAVKGRIVLIEGRAFIPKFRDGSMDSIENIYKQNGAVGIAFYSLDTDADLVRSSSRSTRWHERQVPATDEMTMVLPRILLTLDMVNELMKADGFTAQTAKGSAPVTLKTTLGVDFSVVVQAVTAPNVIGVWPGTDPSLPVVIVSAHHDHDGIKNGVLYPGAVDNASGTAAIMEVASLMQQAAKKGQRPKRTIVFASFTGEESGLLGSYWYADHPLHGMEKTKAVLNIDMLGRVDSFHAGRRADSNYAYILVKDTVGRGLRQSLVNANHSFIGLDLDPFYEDPARQPRRLMGSDQYPFFLKGVPFVRIDCGFCRDYHQPTDTPDKINYDLLTRQTQLAFLTLWNLAND